MHWLFLLSPLLLGFSSLLLTAPRARVETACCPSPDRHTPAPPLSSLAGVYAQSPHPGPFVSLSVDAPKGTLKPLGVGPKDVLFCASHTSCPNYVFHACPYLPSGPATAYDTRLYPTGPLATLPRGPEGPLRALPLVALPALARRVTCLPFFSCVPACPTPEGFLLPLLPVFYPSPPVRVALSHRRSPLVAALLDLFPAHPLCVPVSVSSGLFLVRCSPSPLVSLVVVLRLFFSTNCDHLLYD